MRKLIMICLVMVLGVFANAQQLSAYYDAELLTKISESGYEERYQYIRQIRGFIE